MKKTYPLSLAACFLSLIASTAGAALYNAPAASGVPSCNDAKLLEMTTEKLREFQQEHPVKSIMEKRTQALLLKDFTKLEEVEIEGFTTKDDYNVATKLLTYKINQGISDELARLCKSAGTGPASNLYLLVFRYDYQTLVDIINYPAPQEIMIRYD